MCSHADVQRSKHFSLDNGFIISGSNDEFEDDDDHNDQPKRRLARMFSRPTKAHSTYLEN